MCGTRSGSQARQRYRLAYDMYMYFYDIHGYITYVNDSEGSSDDVPLEIETLFQYFSPTLELTSAAKSNSFAGMHFSFMSTNLRYK